VHSGVCRLAGIPARPLCNQRAHLGDGVAIGRPTKPCGKNTQLFGADNAVLSFPGQPRSDSELWLNLPRLRLGAVTCKSSKWQCEIPGSDLCGGYMSFNLNYKLNPIFTFSLQVSTTDNTDGWRCRQVRGLRDVPHSTS
jgi:hypothetical protein